MFVTMCSSIGQLNKGICIGCECHLEMFLYDFFLNRNSVGLMDEAQVSSCCDWCTCFFGTNSSVWRYCAGRNILWHCFQFFQGLCYSSPFVFIFVILFLFIYMCCIITMLLALFQQRESTSCFNTIKESWDALVSEGQKNDGLLKLTETFHLCR